jgi:cytochrome c oxidase assembly protein subunit 11
MSEQIKPTSDKRIAFRLLGMVAFMLGLSFAAVPLYDWFCRVTGYGGTPDVANAGSDVILDQTIKIRFDASLARGMPWDFKPVDREIEIKIGETGLAFYEASNPSDMPVAGTANFNVFPYSAGAYFTKIDCFCFEQQVLEPGQSVDMPVTFYVDPEILNDPEAKHAKSITLSYTFHETELPNQDVTLGPNSTTQTPIEN